MKSGILCFCALLAVAASRYIDDERVFIRDLDQSGEADPTIVNLKIDHPGKERSLTLRRRDNFNKNVPVFITGEDGKPRKEPKSRSLGTAYHDAENGAAFLISSDLTESGVYRRSVRGLLHDGDYTIHLEPSQEITTDRKRDVDGGVPHLMVRKRNEKADFGIDALSVPGDTIMSKRAEQPIVSKRASGKTAYGIELMFFCDYQCFKYHKHDTQAIKEHFSYVINGMDLRYSNIQDSSFSMYLRLVAIEISKYPDSWTYPLAINGYVQASLAMDKFKKWRESAKSYFPDHDHAMLMTAYNIYMDDGSTSVIGLAYLKSICLGINAVSIVEENQSLSMLISTAAHELGHNIGSRHDGDWNTCRSSDAYIMSPTVGLTGGATYKNPYRFSSCTIANFKNAINALNSVNKNCLLDSAAHGSDVLEVKAPGQKWNADYQCEQEHGAGYKYLRGSLGENTFCKQLNCWKSGVSGWRFGGHASRGTSCGNKKWCVEGDCVYDSSAPAMNSDTCVYGDSLSLWFGSMTCAQLVSQNKAWYCGQSQIKEHCCKSCA
ncbi:A disintegrin and metalloproteinase with thrombospondin motifs adt-2-like [Lineus longissimus]|uniref:A disintegrin and metalloproteinase with thrombospondin motifs adt-2-like n=1 Tax=Lineus longissimus TaxID=88925 RepID=UPI00315C5019